MDSRTCLKWSWGQIRGFMLLAVVTSLLGVFAVWLSPGSMVLTFVGYFSYDTFAALVGLAYIVGLGLLLLYFLSRFIETRGIHVTLMQKLAKLLSLSSLLLFLFFEIVTIIYFVIPPYPFDQGTVCIYMQGCWNYPSPFQLSLGGILGILTISFLTLDYLYDHIFDEAPLRQYYKDNLPEFLPPSNPIQ